MSHKLLVSTCLIFFSLVAQALPVAAIYWHAPRASYLGRLLKRASFTESWSRYPSPDSILNSLKQDFPYANRNSLADAHCDALSASNRKLLGESDPISGRPANEQPNSTFVSWYINCVSQFVVANANGLYKTEIIEQPNGSYESKISNRPSAEMVAYFTPAVTAECKVDPANFQFNLFFCNWSDLSPGTQKNFIKKWIETFVGPDDVVQELGIAASEDEFAQNILSEINEAQFKNDGRYDTFNQGDTAYSVRKVTMIIQMLIHLQDTLKY